MTDFLGFEARGIEAYDCGRGKMMVIRHCVLRLVTSVSSRLPDFHPDHTRVNLHDDCSVECYERQR